MSTARIELPPRLLPVFAAPRGAMRYRAAYGGRGSGKSFNFAKMAAIWGVIEPLRILCTRELQDSIKESFHAELKNAIASEPWLAAAYDVGVDYLRGFNGTEFLFKGLRHNIGSIKSLAQIDLCIVEEAEDIPEASWQALEPTIRAPKSEIWVIWNPRLENSPVDQRFRQNTPPRTAIVEMNYTDNPWFTPVLEEQRHHQQRTLDPETYSHIWEGAYLKQSKATIFLGKWRMDTFTPGADWDGPYHGLDFGFANDPTAGVRCWIYNRRLHIEYEAGKVGLELDDTADYLVQGIPGIERYALRADNARPESISYLKRRDPHGQRAHLPLIVACDKGKGSVEDGIAHMKSYDEIVVHTRCTEVQSEMKKYTHKVDRLSGDVLPDIVDAHNHYIDAIRYALEPVMKARRSIFS
ncbi:PBSX family phage terminase large subunit [Pseudomonas sp. 21LCFQ010]|uniref:PBSX family phage terminase large subunit n=1 Tax=Pseudomonas sp. 21LCFQ010 TaxID=2957506 RepID=UPI0020969C34|nr:PBSX family phage terminase large subunit [Pseudomonas sp. 21LCFQ010]MCO8160964.1 PBSX family phage terminase large subunit [Pseudomonas sp. 21LCFQ010]